jgi:hypothetical protein
MRSACTWRLRFAHEDVIDAKSIVIGTGAERAAAAIYVADASAKLTTTRKLAKLMPVPQLQYSWCIADWRKKPR